MPLVWPDPRFAPLSDMRSIFPTSLRLAGLKVLVVGGGELAERRAKSLVRAGAVVTVVAPTITHGLSQLHAAGDLIWIRREYQSGDLKGCWLVQIATNDPTLNDTIADEAYSAQIFCFKAGDPDGATAWRPAVANLGALTLSVSADANPTLAMTTRDHLLELLKEHPLQSDDV